MANPIKWKPHESTADTQREVQDGNENPLVPGQPFSAHYKELLPKRRQLPVSQHAQDFLDSFHNNQVTLFVGETGSGKTTQLGVFTLYDCNPATLLEGHTNKHIACTQPRVMATEEVTRRVCEENDVQLGEQIGMQYRMCRRSTKRTHLIYLTDGLLVQQTRANKKDLAQYKAIMIDEAHERTFNTDILLSLLKDIMKTRHELKVIIMSATLDINLFQNFFPDAGRCVVRGRKYPVDIEYADSLPSEPNTEAASKAIEIARTEHFGDILIFVSGEKDIGKVINELYDIKGDTPVEIIGLMAGSSREEKDYAMSDPPVDPYAEGFPRKIIVATNVAETSLTFPNVAYVIDTGFAFIGSFDARSDASALRKIPISVAQANQRAGRAGRTMPGKCFRLYPQKTMLEQFSEQSVPEILRKNMDDLVIQLLSMDKDPTTFEYLVAPPTETLLRSYERLFMLGVISRKGSNTYKLTQLGQGVAMLPSVTPHLAVSLIQSQWHNCSNEICCIIAMLQALENDKLWRKPVLGTEAKRNLDRAQRHWMSHGAGEHIMLLSILHAYMNACSVGRAKEFLYDNQLSSRVMQKAVKFVASLQTRMKELNIPRQSLQYDDPQYYAKILRALCIGHVQRAALLKKDKHYWPLHHDCEAEIDTQLQSSVAHRTFVIYDSMTTTDTKTMLKWVSPVDVAWLISGNPRCFEMHKFRPGPVKDKLVEALKRFTNISDIELRGRQPPPPPSEHS